MWSGTASYAPTLGDIWRCQEILDVMPGRVLMMMLHLVVEARAAAAKHPPQSIISPRMYTCKRETDLRVPSPIAVQRLVPGVSPEREKLGLPEW